MKSWYTALFLFVSLSVSAQITNTGQLIDAMQVKYRGKWFREYTFAQQTIQYREGAASDTSLWHEAVSYPDHFRIDFGQPGRFVIFKNDSSWRFTNYKLERTRLEPQEFLLFKGGMYFISPATILDKLREYGYDTAIFREDRLNGRRAYVIGAKAGDLTTKQFWVDADYFYTLRRISTYGNGRTMDVQYSDHKPVEGGWVEQTVSFYNNGQLIQREHYLEIDATRKLKAAIFDERDPLIDWFKK